MNFINDIAMIISAPDGELNIIEDYNIKSLYELFINSGIKMIQQIDNYLRGDDELDLQNDYKNISNQKIFDFCNFLIDQGYVIMIRESASKKQGDGYKNIRLYIPNAYDEYEQNIIITQICRRLELGNMGQYDNTLTVYIGNLLILDHVQLVLLKDLQRIIQSLSFNKEGFAIVSKDGEIYGFENFADAKKLEEHVYNMADLSKKQNLVFSSIQSCSQRVIYIPKNIIYNDQQLKYLELILKIYEDIKNSERELPDDFSLDIFVDGKFLKRMTKHSFNIKNDWNAESIMNKIREKINELNERDCR